MKSKNFSEKETKSPVLIVYFSERVTWLPSAALLLLQEERQESSTNTTNQVCLGANPSALELVLYSPKYSK